MKFSVLLLFAISSTAFARGPAGTFRQAYGPLFRPQPDVTNNAKKFAHEPVHHWNQIAIEDTGLDHTPVAPGEYRTFGEQLGIGTSTRLQASGKEKGWQTTSSTMPFVRFTTHNRPATEF